MSEEDIKNFFKSLMTDEFRLDSIESYFDFFYEKMKELSDNSKDEKMKICIKDILWFLNLKSQKIDIIQKPIEYKEERKTKEKNIKVDTFLLTSLLKSNKEIIREKIEEVLRKNDNKLPKEKVLNSILIIEGFSNTWKKDFVADIIKDFFINEFNYKSIGNGRGKRFFKLIK